MEEEQETKQPCKTCGPTNWNPLRTKSNNVSRDTPAILSRREFFANTAKVTAVAIMTSAVLSGAVKLSRADAIDDYGVCMHDAGYAYRVDTEKCNKIKKIDDPDGSKMRACRHKALQSDFNRRQACKKKLKTQSTA